MCQKGEKCEIAEDHFSKIAKTAYRVSSTEAAYTEHLIAVHSISMVDYVTAVLAFVHAELRAWEASSFCDFENGFLRFHHIFHLFEPSKPLSF